MSAPFDLPAGRGNFDNVQGSSAAAARAIYARRALERALHNGADLMAAHVLRRKLEAVIEDAKCLLCILDEEEGIDPDPMEDREPDTDDLEHDGREEDDPGEAEPDDEDGGDAEASIGWPEDLGAKVAIHADMDQEEDDSDREDDELGDEPAGHPVTWVFGPGRLREARADV